MKNRGLFVCLFAMLVGVLALSLVATAADSSSGTWKVNTQKSTYSPGPAPKNLTVVIECDDNNYKIDATGTDGEGKPIHVQYSAKFDGKDSPATGSPNVDAVAIKRIDANTIETVQKKDGKVVMTITSKVSNDGKTRTSTWRGKTTEGKDVHNVVVFDKQ